MLIWKNDTTTLKSFVFPKSFMLDPDETCKATSLLYTEGLTLIGGDSSTFADFDTPIIKSYTVTDITDVGLIYKVGTTVTVEQAKLAERLDVAIIDSTSGSFSNSPTSNIKIYINL